MKILVFSDSHGVMHFMRQAVESIQPDALIHLGDMVHDGEELSRDFPHVPIYQVAGNCDSNRVPPDYPEVMLPDFSGVRVFMTHGHRHGVKTFLGKLLSDGKQCGAGVILYGHTHIPYCAQEADGTWVMNPGPAGFGASAGIVEIKSGGEVYCRNIRYSDLEVMK